MSCEGVWIRVGADSRGYADMFKCSNCGMIVSTRIFYKECEYPYCPYCRCEMVETEEEEVNGDAT